MELTKLTIKPGQFAQFVVRNAELWRTYEAAVPETACTMRAEMELGARNGAGKIPVKVLARTPATVEHWFYGRVAHELSGMGHEGRLPIDYAHNIDEVLGYLDDVSVTDEGIVGRGYLTPHGEDRAAEVASKAGQGVPYQASINFAGPARIEVVERGAEAQVNGYTLAGPAVIFREWTLRGVAICPYGADPQTSVELMREVATVKANLSIRVEERVTEQKQTEQPAEPAAELGIEAFDDAPAEGLTPEEAPETEAATVAAEAQAGDAPTASQEVPGTEEPAPEPGSMRAECARFIEAFGEQGATWWAEGQSYEASQTAFIAQLVAERDALAQERDTLRDRLAEFRGEGDPVSFEPEGAEPAGVSDLSSKIGDNLARFAAGIRFGPVEKAEDHS